MGSVKKNPQKKIEQGSWTVEDAVQCTWCVLQKPAAKGEGGGPSLVFNWERELRLGTRDLQFDGYIYNGK